VPIYVYRRPDGSTFELEQRITADALTCCPTTRQRVERVMQPFTPRYKGSGFYSTDNRKATTSPPPAPQVAGSPDAARRTQSA
jgi:putative FmdB family regulatory protein